MLLEMWREQARFYGIDPMKIKIERQRETGHELGYDEERNMITSEIQKIALYPHKHLGTLVKRKTKLVTEGELTAYMNRGWQLAKELRSGKMLIIGPS